MESVCIRPHTWGPEYVLEKHGEANHLDREAVFIDVVLQLNVENALYLL